MSDSFPAPSGFVPPASHCLHAGYAHSVERRWHELSSGSRLHPEELVLPIFIGEKEGKEEIKSLPGQYRWGVESLDELIQPLLPLGLSSVLLFSVPSNERKNSTGSFCTSTDNPVYKAVKHLKQYKQLCIIVDICLCAYTDHGHCAILKEDKSIDNQASIDRLAEMSLCLAQAGADIVAPSDMMDGRIGAIKSLLNKHGLANDVAVMSYSSKFYSCYYGPFRDAAGSGAKFGNRSTYQLPIGGTGLALKAIERDLAEGADFLMVKPGMPYLDIVSAMRARTQTPIAIYQVSGEYAMLYWGAQHGAFGLRESVEESLICMKRAGATILITYFTQFLLNEWAKDKQSK